MPAKANWPGLIKRQSARNAEVAKIGSVTVAATAMSLGLAHAGAGSAAGNTDVASDVPNNTGHAAPHL